MLAPRVARAIHDHAILSPGDRVLVAVSGGPDSLALLSLLRELVPSFPINLKVAHFDHGWRAESAGDAAFVAELAARWGYACTVGRPARSLPKSEDAARTARYAFLRDTARAASCAVIALGHTQDDQVETLLLHLLRGSGAHGLAAMRYRSGDLARPLLDVSRSDIEVYLRARNLEPRRDPTNEDPQFARNRLRQSVLPALDHFDPAARRLLARAATILSEEDRFLEELTRNLSAQLLEDRPGFLALPVALQRRLLRRFHPALSFAEVERMRLEGLARTPATEPSPPGRLVVRSCTCDPATFKARDRVGHVDAQSVVAPLHVATRRPGDRVQPLGFPQPKKLQDVLVDAHVPRALRDQLPVVRDQRAIVWIPGVTVAEPYRVTAATREQWHLEIASD